MLRRKTHASSLSNKILLDKFDKFYLTKIHCGVIDKNFRILLMMIMIMMTTIVQMKKMITTIMKMKMMMVMVMVTTDVRRVMCFFNIKT